MFCLRVVFSLDLLIVEKILLIAFMLYYLKAMTVKGVFILISGNIMDDNVLGDVRA